ncbi:MAG: hypothetical protein ABL931_00760 [Usitatibacteraceae bacterium]
MGSGDTVLAWFREYVFPVSKWVFTPLALAFICYAVWMSRSDIASLWRSADPALIALAIVLIAGANFLSPLASRAVLQVFGVSIGYRPLLAIHLSRLPARYLPGGVWHTVGRATDLHNRGVAPQAIAGMVVVENALAITVAIAIGAALLLCTAVRASGYSALFSFAMVLTVLALIALPFLVRKFWIEQSSGNEVVTWGRCSGWFCMIWLAYAFGFVAYSTALAAPVGFISALHTAGLYLFSWGIGLLAFFAPQGIGVFEVTAAALSEKPILPSSIAAVAGFRLCMLVADLGLGLAGQMWRRVVEASTSRGSINVE